MGDIGKCQGSKQKRGYQGFERFRHEREKSREEVIKVRRTYLKTDAKIARFNTFENTEPAAKDPQIGQGGGEGFCFIGQGGKRGGFIT